MATASVGKPPRLERRGMYSRRRFQARTLSTSPIWRRPTDHNILIMKIDDVGAFMEAFLGAVRDDPTILESVISRVAPGGTCFAFSSPDEFETKANAEALALLPQLLDKSFHVRVHRRGFKGRLESHEEERYLGHVLLEAMYAAGQPGALTFEDPDMNRGGRDRLQPRQSRLLVTQGARTVPLPANRLSRRCRACD